MHISFKHAHVVSTCFGAGVFLVVLVSGLAAIGCDRSAGDRAGIAKPAEYRLPRCENPTQPRSSTIDHPIMLSYSAVSSTSETDWPQAELLSAPVWEREALQHQFSPTAPVLPPGFDFLQRGTLVCVVRRVGQRATVIPVDGPFKGQWVWVDAGILSEEIPPSWKPGAGIVAMHDDGERDFAQVVHDLLTKRRLPHL
jgi:hypothetical protein